MENPTNDQAGQGLPLGQQPQMFYVHTECTDDVVRGTFAMPANTSVAQYMQATSSCEPPAVQVPEPKVFCDVADAPAQAPFLTVIMRTQGKRPEEIADVLLCLSAQQDDDFELLIMGHKVPSELQGDLMNIISSYPASLLGRTRYYAVDGGTRTTPLQMGFSVARGRYVAVLDDDDLVMDTWVSNFKELARDHDGQMLYSYVVTQDWEADALPGSASHRSLRAKSGFDDMYCGDFDAAGQLSQNACPLMGLAFPCFAFQDLGVGFDESLTTTEDWDFLMRVYSICGAVSCDQVSAIYRLWTNAESSHTLHDAREWDVNYAVIVDKMNKKPYLLGTGAVEDVRACNPFAAASRAMLVRAASLLSYTEVHDQRDVWDDVAHSHTNKPVEHALANTHAVSGEVDWDLSFIFDDKTELAQLSFTPLAAAFKVLADFKMRLTETSGTVTEMDFANCSFHNGYQVDCNHIVFLKKDPFVAFNLPRPMALSRVDFAFKLMSSVPDFYIDQVARGKYSIKLGRARRWFGRKINGDA